MLPRYSLGKTTPKVLSENRMAFLLNIPICLDFHFQ